MDTSTLNQSDTQLRLLTYPHPTLRHKSKPLRKVDSELFRMIRQMFDIMYAHRGVGLAANQVDLPYRFFVINLTSDPQEKGEELVFINPVILRRRGSEEASEGCLSLPEIEGTVRRSKEIEVSACTLNGEVIHWKMEGLLARAFQHELDHLDGALFIDHLPPSEVLRLRPTIEFWEKEFAASVKQGEEAFLEAVESRLKALEALRT